MKEKLLAETWGEDFIVDINEDGVTELISNLFYGDGARQTLIYYRDKDKNVFKGFADDLLDVEFDNFSYASEYSYYLPEEKVVEIFYWKEENQEFKSKKYEIDFSNIQFERFNSSGDLY